MSYSLFEFIELVGSLGLFLYGMKVMSEGLQRVAGERMRGILSKMTSNRVLGVFTGILVTALIQSSSATTLMAVSFVNAGLLNLAQAIGVIMGANVGTTVTAWVISFLGFKVDISTFAVPLIALALPMIFAKSPKWKSWGEFIIGFAILFLGLQFLKNAMPDLQSNPDALAFLQKYTHNGYASVLLFLLIGTIMTIIVQSSSATVAITLIMCSQGWIPFEIAAAMILGENIGTTITANLAALSANISAKRAAFSHLLFNVLGVLIVLIFFFPYTALVANLTEILGGGDPHVLYNYVKELGTQYDAETMSLITNSAPLTDPTLLGLQKNLMSYAGTVSISLSLFHTLFNVTNILIMIWFVPLYVKICVKVITPRKGEKDKKESSHLHYLRPAMLSTSELSLSPVHKELALYGARTTRMVDMNLALLKETDVAKALEIFNQVEKNENICDSVEVEIANYLTQLLKGDLGASAKEEVLVLMRAATEIESVADACFDIAKLQYNYMKDGRSFSPETVDKLNRLILLTREATVCMNRVLDLPTTTQADIHETYNIENQIDNLVDNYRVQNMKDIQLGRYNYEEAVFFIDISDYCEKLGDYVLNVVQAIVEKKI